MLKIQQLRVSYGGIQALRGIDLEVPDGKIVTLIGANGAGKSTTLRTISGLVKAESGSIQWKRKNRREASASLLLLSVLAEIRLFDLLIGQQLRAGAGHGDVPRLQHIGQVRDLQGHVGVLLDQQYRHGRS